jgi:putative sterol carrier protein
MHSLGKPIFDFNKILGSLGYNLLLMGASNVNARLGCRNARQRERSVLAISPIEELRKRFNAEAAKNLSATYLLQITGDGGGLWMVRIDSGNLELLPFENNHKVSPDCSISVSSEDLAMIISGKLSAMTAALSGILSVDGSLGLAMQLVPIFFEGQSPHIF